MSVRVSRAEGGGKARRYTHSAASAARPSSRAPRSSHTGWSMDVIGGGVCDERVGACMHR